MRYQTALNSDSIETYQPREGPETRQAPCKLSHKQVYPPIYLERGRKQLNPLKLKFVFVV